MTDIEKVMEAVGTEYFINSGPENNQFHIQCKIQKQPHTNKIVTFKQKPQPHTNKIVCFNA